MAGVWDRFKAGVAGWTFSYVRPVLRVGYRQPLQTEDLPHLTGTSDAPPATAGLLKEQLQRHKSWWYADEDEATDAAEREGEEDTSKLMRWYAASGAAARMWAVFLLAYGPWLVKPAVCKLFGDLLGFVPPLCLNQLLLALEAEAGDPNTAAGVEHEWQIWNYLSWSNAYFYAIGIFIAFSLQSILLHQHHNVVIRVGMWARSSLSILVYEKCLRLSVTSRAMESSGKINTLLSTDAAIIEHAFWNGNYIWSAPLQIVIAFVLLFREVGFAVLAGVAVMILLIISQTFLGRLQASIRKTKVQHTDRRVSHTSECMSGIRVLKLYAWEFLFGDRVLHEREKELQDLRKIALWRALNDALLTSGPTLVTLAAFTFYGVLQNSLGSDPLTAAKAFTALSLFNLLRLPLLTLPDIFVTIFNSFFSMRRFRDVLCASEAETLPITGVDAFMVEMERVDEEPIAVSVTNGVFSWEGARVEHVDAADESPLFSSGSTSQWTLEIESLRIPRGHLAMIVGPVGSGKSSAILKDMVCFEGNVELNSTSLALCAQQPWILNATVRENILFGRQFEQEFYDAVVFACALQTDFLLLPHGDSTEIGEKGVNLSGGQRARVSLARAVYAQADLILLDDVLAAVDAHVGEHIFRHCIMGLLEGTTRVLVTNSTSIRDDADWIVCMDSATDVATGARRSFVSKQGRNSDLTTPTDGSEGQSQTSGELEDNDSAKVVPARLGVGPTPEELEEKALEAVEDLSVYFEETVEEGETVLEDEDTAGSARLTEDEDRAVGQVRLSVLGRWLAALPLPVSAFMLIVLMVQSGLSLVMYWWLSVWSGDQLEKDVMYYVMWYAVISFAVVGMIFVFRVIMALCGVLASRRLHEEMLLCILRAPTSFFDKTPMGRIINRFTNDFYVVDEQLAAQLGNTLSRIAAIVATLLLLLFLVPWLAIVLLPSLVVYFKMQQYYSASSRELRRLDKITKSPVFHAISEVVDGMTTIRAFRAEERFEQRMAELLEYNLRSFWFSHQINRWLGIRLEVIGAGISSAVACAGIFFRSSLSASFVGLMLTSVERIGHYSGGIEQEYSVEDMTMARNHKHGKANDDSASWTPDSGELDFQNVTLRYKPSLPPALDAICFHLDEGEKAGVCGRTGAGKSSLIQALFRLVDVSSGCIRVGGVDTTKVPLHELRSALTVIPQEPLLFSGTVRYNLDPFQWYSDAELWRALEEVELKTTVSDLGNGLDSPVTEGGRNFSVGQRQLLCIARAVLRHSKVVVFDEATAAVDAETDELIQRMLRQVFASSTCLTIAHRLNTVMDCSTILVMEAGQVLEQGAPLELLQEEDGTFAGLVRAAGIGETS